MNTKKNILYFCSSGIFGGAERFVETCLFGHIDHGDFDARVFFLNQGDFSDHCVDSGFNVDYTPYKVRLVNIFSWVIFQFYFFNYIKKNKIDVVHLTMPYSQVFAAIASRLAGAKIVWFQHGPVGGLIDKIANLLPYDIIYFNSEFTKQEHLKTVGNIRGDSKIITLKVRTSVDQEAVNKIHNKYNSSKALFISSGRICRWKGFEHAIEAIKLLKQDELASTLLILGKPSTNDDQKYLNELKALVIEGNLEEEVKFLGFKSNVYDYVYCASALLHTSITPEPFGLVIAEAISLSTYVFATASGGAMEQFKDGEQHGEVYTGEDLSIALYKSLKSKYPHFMENAKRNMRKTLPHSVNNNAQPVEMMNILNNSYTSL